TGTPSFYVWHPEGWSQRALTEQIRSALRIATQRAYLRPNAVAALSGKNSGDNSGVDFPTVHFHEWQQDEVKVGLMLKGGGSENCGCQFSIPSPELAAGRDIQGVRKAVLTAAHKAQGFGCAPGTLGVGIGGDRMTSFEESKLQLLRRLDDSNPDDELAALEREMYEKLNGLEIGPMGFGGRTTLLGVKIGTRHRLPACFFVSVTYMCWAYRRRRLVVRDDDYSID
ncbi:MAG: fumarate hydratase, partial [Deltaproteobacteria bacterium]